MRVRTLLCGFVIAVVTGCGGDPAGDLPATKPMTAEESDRIAKQVQEGMKQGYKGAPGVPLKTSK